MNTYIQLEKISRILLRHEEHITNLQQNKPESFDTTTIDEINKKLDKLTKLYESLKDDVCKCTKQQSSVSSSIDIDQDKKEIDDVEFEIKNMETPKKKRGPTKKKTVVSS